MTIEDRLFSVIGDMERSLGRIEAQGQSTLSFLESVNKNQKSTEERLSSHINSSSAHGAGDRSRVWSGIGKVLTGVGTVVAIVVAIITIVRAFTQ